MTGRTATLARDVRGALPRLVWLWLLWLVLWGSVSPVVLVGGLLVSAAVTFAFPLPALSSHVTVRPVALLWLVGHLLVDLVTSAGTVARAAVRRNRPTRAVVEVPLLTDNDVLITVVAQVTTMMPGTLVLEIDRRRRRLYVHALPAGDEVEYRRQEVRDVEGRVLRTFAHKRGDGSGREAHGGTR